jgi:hypothetical protein
VVKKSKNTGNKKKERVKVGNLETTRELSVEDAKKVKGGKLLEAVVKGKPFSKVSIHGTSY